MAVKRLPSHLVRRLQLCELIISRPFEIHCGCILDRSRIVLKSKTIIKSLIELHQVSTRLSRGRRMQEFRSEWRREIFISWHAIQLTMHVGIILSLRISFRIPLDSIAQNEAQNKAHLQTSQSIRRVIHKRYSAILKRRYDSCESPRLKVTLKDDTGRGFKFNL